MNSIGPFVIFAQQPPAGQPTGPGMEPMFMMVLVLVIMWVLMIRPQRKRQKELEAKIAALKVGDKVITAGGLHGLVVNVKERTVVLKIPPDSLRLEFEKSAISTTIPKDTGEASEPKEPALPEVVEKSK